MANFGKALLGVGLILTAACGRNVFDKAEKTKNDDLTEASQALEAGNPDKAMQLIFPNFPPAAQELIANGDPMSSGYADSLAAAIGTSPNSVNYLTLYGTALMQKGGADLLGIATTLSAKTSAALALVEDARNTPLCQIARATTAISLETAILVVRLYNTAYILHKSTGVAFSKDAAFAFIPASAISLVKILQRYDTDNNGTLSSEEIAAGRSISITFQGINYPLVENTYNAAKVVETAVESYKEHFGEDFGNSPGAVSKAIKKINDESDKMLHRTDAPESSTSDDLIILYLTEKLADKQCF